MFIIQSHRIGSNTRAAAKRMQSLVSSSSCRYYHSNQLHGSRRQAVRGMPALYRHQFMRLAKGHPMKSWLPTFSTVSRVHLDEAKDGMEYHRQIIIRASLEKVHTLGWTQDAIVAAVLELKKHEYPNYNVSMSGLCTPSDLISCCMEDWNDQLEQYISTKNDEFPSRSNEHSQSDRMQSGFSEEEKVKTRLFDAYKFRLSLIIPFLQSRTWHEAMAKGLVENAVTTHTQVHQVVELLSELAAIDEQGNGYEVDIAQRINRTGHQALLGSIYVATELHMLTDTSPDYQDSWEFLQARIDDYYNCSHDGPLQGTMNHLINSLSAAAGTSSPNSFSNPLTALLQGPVIPATTAVVSSLLDGAASVFLTPNQQGQWKNATPNMGTSAPFAADVRKKGRPTSPKSEVFGANPEDYDS